jgi:hypothetical protein
MYYSRTNLDHFFHCYWYACTTQLKFIVALYGTSYHKVNGAQHAAVQAKDASWLCFVPCKYVNSRHNYSCAIVTQLTLHSVHEDGWKYMVHSTVEETHHS